MTSTTLLEGGHPLDGLDDNTEGKEVILSMTLTTATGTA